MARVDRIASFLAISLQPCDCQRLRGLWYGIDVFRSSIELLESLKFPGLGRRELQAMGFLLNLRHRIEGSVMTN